MENEKRMSFIPNIPWKSGNYEVIVDIRAEDSCGNNLIRLFDQDEYSDKNEEESSEFKSISFIINK